MNIKKREANFEMLRLIAIFGIVTMHSFGMYRYSVHGSNIVYGVFINTLFNCGVSIFVLISGYFGIHTSSEKILKLWMEVFFYSILSEVVAIACSNTWSLKDFVKACIPFSTGVYWYITSYLLLMLFANFINLISEKLDKKHFQVLLIIMISVFSVLPTITHYHVMNDDGKGPINMLLMYLIGRYIAKYPVSYSTKNILIAIVLFVLQFVCNLLFTNFKGSFSCPFAADYSIFIILLSVLIFLIFKQISLSNKWINILAKHVLGIYLFEGAVRVIINQFIDMEALANNTILPIILIGYVLIIMTICIFIDIVRSVVFTPFEKIVYKIKGFICERINLKFL